MLKVAILSMAQISLVQATPSTNTYLILPDLATALTRSEQQCIALGCDGKQTKYWWNVIPLKDGTAAIEVQADGPLAAQMRVKDQKGGQDKIGGLVPNEAAALVNAATIDPLLPKPDPLGEVKPSPGEIVPGGLNR